MQTVQPWTPKTSDRYRLLVEAVTDYAIYMLDPAGYVSSWNPGARRFKQYESGEILGQHFSRFYTEEDRATGLPQRALDTAAREGKFESEGWRVRKDGTRFWAHVLIDPIFDPSGTLLGFAKVTRDLTERKGAEETLRRSEENFRLLVESVTDYAIYMLDRDGRITNWNPGAQRLKGYRPDEIIGDHFSRFYTDEDRERGEPQRALETTAREGRFEKEGWRVRKDGTRFLANVVIDPIRDSSGAVIGFAKVTRDITEKVATQKALDETREALFQAQKLEAIGQLTGGIAHDFNNLLMAIYGSLDLLRKRLPDDPKIMELIDNAVKGAERGAALTKRMLAFARRQDLKLEAVDVPALVHGMTELLQRSLGPAISIEARFPLGISPVLADAHQLEMALLNLAVNARDAMPDGGEIVIVGLEERLTPDNPARLPPGRYICLSVKDTGEGMDAATLARATEPFFTTKGVGKGTGLGLSMVHGIAEQSGGRLFLKSEKDKGTTAELWFPATAKQDGPPLPAPDSQPATRPLVVLAVDDDLLILTNTAAMLEDLGHKAVEALTAKEAIEILRFRQDIDLVITDQAMPQMTGMQFAEVVRTQWPHVPVILASGYAELLPDPKVDVPKLNKPFWLEDLAHAIAKVMKSARAA